MEISIVTWGAVVVRIELDFQVEELVMDVLYMCFFIGSTESTKSHIWEGGETHDRKQAGQGVGRGRFFKAAFYGRSSRRGLSRFAPSPEHDITFPILIEGWFTRTATFEVIFFPPVPRN